MKLRFEVNQAECMRRGIDCPRSIVTVEVDPEQLSQDDRNLLADRMDGIDVCWLERDRRRGESCPDGMTIYRARELGKVRPGLIAAGAPTFEALMEAVREDEASLPPKKTDPS